MALEWWEIATAVIVVLVFGLFGLTVGPDGIRYYKRAIRDHLPRRRHDASG